MSANKDDDFQWPSPPSEGSQAVITVSANKTLFGERFELLEATPRKGNLGEVYLCSFVDHPESRVALKTFQYKFFFRRSIRESFIREISIWRRLTGLPHIIPTLGVEVIEGRPFIVMIAVDDRVSPDGTLRGLMATRALSGADALRYAFQIASGMCFAQKKFPTLVHGDLKPENILLQDELLYLADFGLAQVANSLRKVAPVKSTYAYRAPECWDENWLPSTSADIYAFGVILYEMLAGRLPFNAAGANEWKEAHLHGQIESTSHNREGAGLLLAELALECLSKDADARPHSFAQILDKLIPIGLDAEPAVMELLIASDVFELDNLGLTRSILLPSLISDLLTLEQPVQALEELSTVSPEALSPELMLQKGTALSLVGHEEQAIETFNQVLKNELTEEQRFRCLNELGLSLKHQHRYQEAEDIFKDLLNDVPEPDLSRTVVNLASVYLEVGNPQAAVSILKRHLVKHVNEASAWTSLGVAQRACADYPSAAQSFRQAIRLNHNQSLAYFQLASLNMDYADRLNPVEALATLEAAYQQGLDHPQLIPRLLTCYVVLEEVDKARQLIPKLKSDFEGELIDLIAQELSMYSPADHGAHERLLRYLVALYRVKLEEIP